MYQICTVRLINTLKHLDGFFDSLTSGYLKIADDLRRNVQLSDSDRASLRKELYKVCEMQIPKLAYKLLMKSSSLMVIYMISMLAFIKKLLRSIGSNI